MNNRFKTRVVKVKNVLIGGDNPIRIQSMTTSRTDDVENTLKQILTLHDHGCEIVRVTVQGQKEAYACEKIKNELLKKNISIPIVADIHFYPKAALIVADFVDKIRINPGNYVDKRAVFKTIEYDDDSYKKELLRIEEGFLPLIEKCKKNQLALRIGVNHGSLSDRIMSRYGNTINGMVESALEYTKICRKYDFHDIVFSMKASSSSIMIQAYHQLVRDMEDLNWNYPMHLGVTEAGNGVEGRIKSSIGIGSLLLDGIGDTIRVSLTENPENEIEPARKIVSFSKQVSSHKPSRSINTSKKDIDEPSFLKDYPYVVQYLTKENLLNKNKDCSQADVLFIKEITEDIHSIVDDLLESKKTIISPTKYKKVLQLISVNDQITSEYCLLVSDEDDYEKVIDKNPHLIFFKPKKSRVENTREFFEFLEKNNIKTPVILDFEYSEHLIDLIYLASMELGSLLSDRLGDGVMIESSQDSSDLIFSIFQGCNLRNTKCDFISCPGCGRTLFDIQSVTNKIKAKFEHLKGVKLAVMGCIVNGPGEMADADFGYVGSKANKVDLFVGKKCVKKDIDFDKAENELISLIKTHGRWIDK